MQLLGISHHLLQLFLCIEIRTIVACNYLALAILVDDDVFVTDRADFGQLWVFLDFDTPALIVGEMPVKTVHFVVRHYVEHALYLVYGEEMARNIEHVASVAESRFVGDRYQR